MFKYRTYTVISNGFSPIFVAVLLYIVRPLPPPPPRYHDIMPLWQLKLIVLFQMGGNQYISTLDIK